MKSLFVLAFLLCISAGYGLKCYQCTSSKGWDDCADNKKEMTCPDGADRCIKYSIDGKTAGVEAKLYQKTCTAASVCDMDLSDACKKFSTAYTDVTCKRDCCTGDLCNGAKVPMVSAIILLACALVAFLA